MKHLFKSFGFVEWLVLSAIITIVVVMALNFFFWRIGHPKALPAITLDVEQQRALSMIGDLVVKSANELYEVDSKRQEQADRIEECQYDNAYIKRERPVGIIPPEKFSSTGDINRDLLMAISIIKDRDYTHDLRIHKSADGVDNRIERVKSSVHLSCNADPIDLKKRKKRKYYTLKLEREMNKRALHKQTKFQK